MHSSAKPWSRLAAAFLLTALPLEAAQLRGLWLFDDPTLPGKATVGNNLTIAGTPPAYSSTLADAGGTSLSGVITTVSGAANALTATHGITPTAVSQYSILADIFSPVASRSSWRSIYQTSATPAANDAEYFIRNSNDTLGIADIGYSGTAIPETLWTRLVITVDLTQAGGAAAPKVKTYLNGALVYSHTGTTNAGTTGRFALDSVIHFFADNDGENGSLNVAALAIYGGVLTAGEVTALGAAGAPIANQPPSITEGSPRTLDATKNGPGVDLAFNAIDPNGDTISWSVATAPAHGSTTIVSSSTTQCTVRYTPQAGYSGTDSYTVQAGDGSGSTQSVVNVFVRDPATPPYPNPVGWWQFDHAFDHTLATIGSDLTTSGSGFSEATGLAPGDGAMLVASGSYYIANHGIAAGTGGGTKVNEYSLLFDISYPAAGWKCLYQADGNNTTDGELFIDTSNRVGIAAMGGYSTNTTAPDTWYRVVVSVDNGTDRRIYVNGQLWYDGNAGALDDRHALAPLLLAFADEDGEDGPIRVSNLALWNTALNATQAAALGGAGAFIADVSPPQPNHPPVIAETSPVSVNAGMAVPTPITFHVSDADNNAITWTIQTLPAHGNAVISVASNSVCTVTYASANNHTGADNFVVRASDGKAFADVSVALQVQNSAPVISEGDSYLLNATLNGSEQTATFTAADPNGNALSWSIATAPQHGSAGIIGSINGTCQVGYTPAAGYTGADSFVVAVSDGQSSDSIVVQVTVVDPGADPVLTVISAHGSATPASGNHSYPGGTELHPSATDEIGANTRHLCVGWTMIGNDPGSGTGSSFTMSLTRNSTLTWLWRTEHRVVTATSGNGTVSVASGWQEGGKPLQITATPAPGYHFAGWTGDTSGAITGGKNIVLPMTRPYATITANFSADENFTVVALPDTQNYTSLTSPTDTFTRQTQWVLDNKETLNIKFLTHLGDIVNSPTNTSQWTRATDAMNLLNAQLAYGTCPGNHDLASGSNHYLERFGPNPTHASSVGRWINPATNQVYDWYRGSSPRGYSSYQIVPVNGRDFMFMHLDHDCPDEDMAWASSVLSAHPQVLTMITTHNYLAETGGTGVFGTGTGERGYTAQPNVSIGPDRNKPEEVFNALVKPFNQVYMVICGHMFAIYNLEKINAAGNTVHEVLCDYQSLPNGGNGFLRIMDFRPGENKIYNSTYSPTLGRYVDPNLAADRQGMLDLHDPNGGEFVLDLDFDGRFNSTLTVASAHPSVIPAVGTHQVSDGSPIVVSASNQVSGLTRHRPSGWTLSGKQNSSGSGSTATTVQNGDATLTWTWATDYWLDTATTGNGIVSIGDGWQAAGANVSIQAQADAGSSFLQWSGDIAGCTIEGSRITVPVDRPRGPVTAVFDSGTPTFAVQVVSAHSSTSPAPASYAYEQGSSVSFSASTFTDGDTRYLCNGYQLAGASTASGTASEFSTTISGNLTVTWLWKTQHRVTANSSGPGAVTPTDKWVDAGQPLVLGGTPDSGAALVSWTGDTTTGTANGNSFTIPAVNRPTGPITANFSVGMHTLTIVSTQSTVTPAAGSLVLPHGSVVHFSALPNVTGTTRQSPAGWTVSGGQSGTGSSGSLVLNSDAMLTWSWSPEVRLTLGSGLEGVILPMDAAGWKPLGSQVTLEARPAGKFLFARWRGDVPADATSPQIVLTMDQPRTVTADLSPQVTAAGTPYWWLDAHGLVSGGDYAAADFRDADGDGQIARDEFVAGMDDRDPARRFYIEQSKLLPGPFFQLSWQSETGRNYVVRSSPDLTTPFVDLLGPLPGQRPSMSAQVPASGSRRLYRIEALLPEGTPLDGDPLALSHQAARGSVLRDMRRIPAGWSTQGDNGGVQTSKPAHATLVAGFEMDRFEVTRGDWEAVATWGNAHGYDLPVTLPYSVPLDHPAVAVSWYDAVKWCNARSEMEGRIPVYRADLAGLVIYRSGQLDLTAAQVNWSGNGYRLPTEAEWEGASRGGIEGQPYPWGGGSAELRANHWNYELFIGRAPSEDYPYTQRVGFFDGTQPGGAPDSANGYGLYDMTGNAWEWTWDRMGDYSAEAQVDPHGPDSGEFRVLRGGSWWNYVDQSSNHQRLAYPPTGNDDYGMLGFRCVRGLHPNE
ncbi:SUMF1/EgtB/PvdO family nonheme iron enzyme [Haloferula sp. BvORR071]|uniref:SUMF1/EgtB/PvdO family nonheme iron enzyme n=1 Tax=Haloferula sp. BvORR071 TaxID=1396141 RepID=UPI00054DD1D3|nr:SUMF1/EgtB/PvdO family nonheme iron enzyme [Haloferula sp. BvORR071]